MAHVQQNQATTPTNQDVSSRPLDHGVLNVPLAKRGNIDAQIDRYKAEQAKAAKATARSKAAEIASQREEAKAFVAGLSDERIAEVAQKIGSTPSKVRKELNSLAYFDPAKVLRMKAAEVSK